MRHNKDMKDVATVGEKAIRLEWIEGSGYERAESFVVRGVTTVADAIKALVERSPRMQRQASRGTIRGYVVELIETPMGPQWNRVS